MYRHVDTRLVHVRQYTISPPRTATCFPRGLPVRTRTRTDRILCANGFCRATLRQRGIYALVIVTVCKAASYELVFIKTAKRVITQTTPPPVELEF